MSQVASPFGLRQESAMRKRTARAYIEHGLGLGSFLATLVSVITTFGIIFILFGESWSFFQDVSVVDFLTGTKWAPLYEPRAFGILPLLSGTMIIAAGAALLAIPLGLLSAVYLSEYATPRVRSILKPALEVLAGIPTVVYGYFGLIYVTDLLQKINKGFETFNAASGAIVVGIMVLPMVSSLCEDAIAAVPKHLREAAYGLGATKFEVVTKVVIPAALSGIMSSFVLALSRAVGETMAVTLAAGQMPQLTWDARQGMQTMTAYIVKVSQGDTPAGSIGYKTIFAVGLTLFILTFILNLFARRLVTRFRSVYQ